MIVTKEECPFVNLDRWFGAVGVITAYTSFFTNPITVLCSTWTGSDSIMYFKEDELYYLGTITEQK